MRLLSVFGALAAVATEVSASHASQLAKVDYRLRARATGKGLTSPDKPQQTGTVENCELFCPQHRKGPRRERQLTTEGGNRQPLVRCRRG